MPLVDDVGGEFRRRVFQRHLDGLHDGGDRLGQAFGDLALADQHLARHAVHQVAALDLAERAVAFLVVGHGGGADHPS